MCSARFDITLRDNQTTSCDCSFSRNYMEWTWYPLQELFTVQLYGESFHRSNSLRFQARLGEQKRLKRETTSDWPNAHCGIFDVWWAICIPKSQIRNFLRSTAAVEITNVYLCRFLSISLSSRYERARWLIPAKPNKRYHDRNGIETVSDEVPENLDSGLIWGR
jgi:hypothetical protein